MTVYSPKVCEPFELEGDTVSLCPSGLPFQALAFGDFTVECLIGGGEGGGTFLDALFECGVGLLEDGVQAFAFSDIPRDLGHADDPTGALPNGRDS